MLENTDLSIIIPVYNGEKYVKTIVNEILSFNKGSDVVFELLLIDDGSLDKSAEVCKELADNYDNIHYFYKDNGGIASARNYGLNIAKGDYITFADQDDLVLTGYEPFIKRCYDDNLDMLITSPYNKKNDSKQINKRAFKNEIIDNKEQIRLIAGKLIDGKYLSNESTQSVSTSVWNVLYRREMLIHNGIEFKVFIDYEDDWIFNIETLMASERIAISSDGYYCWNIHEESESHRKKYISDLAEKRHRWMIWLNSILNQMEIPEEKKNKFIQSVLIPRNIMMCFNNSCWKPKCTRNEAVKEIEESNSLWKIKTIELSSVDEMDKPNIFLLKLLYHKRINLAYELNRKILGKRFH